MPMVPSLCARSLARCNDAAGRGEAVKGLTLTLSARERLEHELNKEEHQ